MNKKGGSLILFLAFIFSGSAQDIQMNKELETINDTLYVLENGAKYRVDKSQVVVKLKDSIKNLPQNIKLLRTHRLGYIDIEVPKDNNVIDYVEKLKSLGIFESVDYISEVKTCFTINDHSLVYDPSRQWYIDRINLWNTWDITTGISSIKIAVIDSGVNWNNPDLGYGDDTYTNLDSSLEKDYLSDPYDQYGDWHGTSTAGVIGAKTNNGEGVAGVAGGNNSHGATVISYRIIKGTTSPATYVADAIIDATDDGVKVINCSFDCNSTQDRIDAITYAYNHGVTIVCSTGNYNNSNITFPASDTRTIAVGAINNYDLRWSESSSTGSNYGSGIDLVAPGVDVFTTFTYTYGNETGTSVASPFVAGTVALMRSMNSSLSPSQIRDILQKTATKISGYTYNSSGWNSEVGYGVLNAFAAVLGACNTSFLEDTSICYGSSASFSLNNLPSGLTVQWSITDGYGPTTPTIQTSGNSCSITNNLSMTFSGKLNAKVYDGTNLIATLTKNLVLYSDFYGQYTSDNLSGTIDYTHIFYVKPGYNTTITSLNLIGATASYSSSGTTPSYFSLDPTLWKLYFTMPTNNNGIPVIINVTDLCGNQFQLYAIPQSSYYLNISYEDSNINISLNENGNTLRNPSIEQPWSYEIRSATRGDIKASGKVYSSSTTISTAGWPKGIYIVKATIGKEETTEKIIVR